MATLTTCTDGVLIATIFYASTGTALTADEREYDVGIITKMWDLGAMTNSVMGLVI